MWRNAISSFIIPRLNINIIYLLYCILYRNILSRKTYAIPYYILIIVMTMYLLCFLYFCTMQGSLFLAFFYVTKTIKRYPHQITSEDFSVFLRVYYQSEEPTTVFFIDDPDVRRECRGNPRRSPTV